VERSGPGVEVDALLMLEHPDTRVDSDVYAHNGCGLRCAILCKDAATLDGDFVGEMDIDGDTVPGGCGLGLGTMPLDGLDTRRDVLREESKRVAGGDKSLCDAAGDNGSDALAGERAVDGQPCGEEWIRIRKGYDSIHKRCAELVHSLPSDGADGEHFCAGEWCCGEAFADVILDERKQLGSDEVDTGDGNEHVFDAQSTEELDVFAGLWHRSAIRRDNQQGDLNSACTGKHIADELFVAWDIHKRDLRFTWAFREAGKPEVNRHPALLFLEKTIGIHPGQGLDKRGLSVIDMPSGPDDALLCHAWNSTGQSIISRG